MAMGRLLLAERSIHFQDQRHIEPPRDVQPGDAEKRVAFVNDVRTELPDCLSRPLWERGCVQQRA